MSFNDNYILFPTKSQHKFAQFQGYLVLRIIS